MLPDYLEDVPFVTQPAVEAQPKNNTNDTQITSSLPPLTQTRTIQLKNVRQFYRFAELGQLSSSLLHEVANQLAVLNLQVSELHKEHPTNTVQQIKETTSQLNYTLQQAHKAVWGKAHSHAFNVTVPIEAAIQAIKKAKYSSIPIEMEVSGDKKRLTTFGNPAEFMQVMRILIMNAIEAYESKSTKSKVLVEVIGRESAITITVHDWGVGIEKDVISRLFQPFHSTKQGLAGMGLTIARHILQGDFQGSVDVNTSSNHTEFVVQVPSTKLARNFRVM